MVARELERWDEGLRADAQLQVEYQRLQQTSPEQLSDEQQGQILALSRQLPRLWSASTTPPENLQIIARLLREQVQVNIEGNSERVEVELGWAGGFVSRPAMRRPVTTYEQLSNYAELLTRIESLVAGRDRAATEVMMLVVRIRQPGVDVSTEAVAERFPIDVERDVTIGIRRHSTSNRCRS